MSFRKAFDQFITLKLLKLCITDSPSLTNEVAKSSEEVTRYILDSFVRLISELIRDAIQNHSFNPTAEINKLAVEIYIFDVNIFRQVFDCVFKRMDTLRDFEAIRESINNFSETSCQVESYCQLHNNMIVTPRFMCALSDLLKTPDLDEDDGTMLENILKKTKIDSFIPFIQLSANTIRISIEANKFNPTTEAQKLAVEIHNYDLNIFEKVFECVFQVMDVDEYFKQISASLGSFQDHGCAVDAYCVLFKSISSLYDHLWAFECAVSRLLKTPTLSKKNSEKLTKLLKQIKDVSNEHLQASTILSNFEYDYD